MAHFKEEVEVVRVGWRWLSCRVGLIVLRRSLLLHIARSVRCLVVNVPLHPCYSCSAVDPSVRAQVPVPRDWKPGVFGGVLLSCVRGNLLYNCLAPRPPPSSSDYHCFFESFLALTSWLCSVPGRPPSRCAPEPWHDSARCWSDQAAQLLRTEESDPAL